MNTERRGSLYAILSGLLYGFIGYFGLSVVHAHFSVSTMLFWRFLISSIAIALAVLIKKNTHQIYRQDLILAFINGALFYAPSTLIYFYACLYIGSGLAMVIFFTYPAMIMIMNYFLFNQPIPRLYYISSAIILIGMSCFIDWHELRVDLMGLILSMISAFFYAAYMISSKKTSLPPMTSTLMVSMGCMTSALIVSCFNHDLALPNSIPVSVYLLGIGVISTAIPIVLLLQSLKYISAEKASLLSVLEPLFVVIIGVLLLGESLQLKHIIGVFIVLAGAILTLFSHRVSKKLIM